MEEILINYNIQYTCVIVIQSLSNNETSTGKELYDNIIARRCEQRKLQSFFIDVYDKRNFLNEMGRIADAVVNKGHYPIIHFEIHGSEKGFMVASGEMIEWKEIAYYCRGINIKIKNTLTISLATCKGACMYKMIDILQPAPFWGIIGPKEVVIEEEFTRDFSDFYNILLGDHDLGEALKALNLYHDGYKYVIITSEMLFDELQDDISKNPWNKSQMFSRFKNSTKDYHPQLNRGQRRLKLKSSINNHNRKLYLTQVRQNFLMC